MDLKIEGHVVELLPEQSGEGRNGPWRKQEFILETEGDYPAKICVVQWGDDIEKFGVAEGDRLTAHIDIRSREYQGRWYTDVKAWRIHKQEEGGARDGPRDVDAGQLDAPSPDFDTSLEGDEDLPF